MRKQGAVDRLIGITARWLGCYLGLLQTDYRHWSMLYTSAGQPDQHMAWWRPHDSSLHSSQLFSSWESCGPDTPRADFVKGGIKCRFKSMIFFHLIYGGWALECQIPWKFGSILRLTVSKGGTGPDRTPDRPLDPPRKTNGEGFLCHFRHESYRQVKPTHGWP